MAAAAKLLRHVGRKRTGRFLAEGPHLVEAAVRAGSVIELFVTEEASVRHRDLLAGQRAFLITDGAAKALSDTVTPAGLIALCERPASSLDQALGTSPQLVAVSVGLSEPGNLGTLIRIAHAMGAGAVVIAGHSVDPYNGKCVRASTGSIFALPVVVEPDAGKAVDTLRNAGLQVLATALHAELTLEEAEPMLTAPTAWLFGPEARGLPPEIAELADHSVRIEMARSAESLNVAAAAAICLYRSALASRR